MNEILNATLFTLGSTTITVGQLLLAAFLLVVVVLIYRFFINRFFPHLSAYQNMSEGENKKLRSHLFWILGTLIILLILVSFKFDYTIYEVDDYDFQLTTVIKAVLFFQIARLLDWLISNLFKNRYYLKKQEQESTTNYIAHKESSYTRAIVSIFYVLALLYVLNAFNFDYTIFEFEVKEDGESTQIPFRISRILHAVLIILVARLVIWLITQLVLFNVYRSKQIDLGSQYAINQLITYVVFVIAIIYALQELGINMTLLLGGAAALLVGIGLGLQQTFNDFISGIVLLFERSVSIGDVLEFEGTVGTIKRIGLRASLVETRENISLVVPNHMLVNNNVINWTHFNDKIRFKIEVGVAYGSDTTLVKKILLEIVRENPFALEYPSPLVRLEGFGDSSLNFGLYFFSRNYMVIEDIKSDIRLAIDAAFREHNISIPFPQRDVHVIKDDGS